MDLDIKRIIDLHKIDQQMLEIHEGKGDLPNIINDQEYKIEELNEQVLDNKEALESLNKNINQLNIKTEEFSSLDTASLIIGIIIAIPTTSNTLISREIISASLCIPSCPYNSAPICNGFLDPANRSGKVWRVGPT